MGCMIKGPGLKMRGDDLVKVETVPLKEFQINARSSYAILAYATIWTLLGGLKSLSAIEDYARRGGQQLWKPVVWEMSSLWIIGVLFPIVFLFSRWVAPQCYSWTKTLFFHVAGMLCFWILHVALMVSLRKVSYQSVGAEYVFDGFVSGWLYELSKDWLTYAALAGISAVIVAWKLRARTFQSLVSHVPGNSLMILLKEDGRTVNLDTSTICWLKAEGNYVRIQCDSESYFIRRTLKSFGVIAGLVQTHRSMFVNSTKVLEVSRLQKGDYLLRLRGGHDVRLSRRFRGDLFGRLQRDPSASTLG